MVASWTPFAHWYRIDSICSQRLLILIIKTIESQPVSCFPIWDTETRLAHGKTTSPIDESRCWSTRRVRDTDLEPSQVTDATIDTQTNRNVRAPLPRGLQNLSSYKDNTQRLCGRMVLLPKVQGRGSMKMRELWLSWWHWNMTVHCVKQTLTYLRGH